MNESSVKKALVAMSGGVDSSVAAFLMKEKGYEPVGVTMMLHDQEEVLAKNAYTCCTPDDIEDARVVASQMGIPFHVVNFMDGFREKIVDKFIDTYLRGETPNPCIDCNRYMKFGRLFEMADEEGCEKVVTGHYAIIEWDEKQGVYKLKRGNDKKKDQTYVLYFLTQKQLARLDFPIGEHEKEEVREIAEREGLIVARKHDSQDICFVPDGDYAGFIEKEGRGELGTIWPDTLDYSGDFTDIEGNVIGKHKGFFHYTIGQRKGLGISAAQPLYVVDIIPKENRVVLGSNDDLFTREVNAVDFNMMYVPDIIEKSEDGSMRLRVTAKVRYRAQDTPGELIVYPDGRARMTFDEAVRAVTPGQSLVVYDGEYCLGGGIITR